jgi:hypothetical protein
MMFHQILSGCEEGNPEVWRGFLANYTPMALYFLSVYSPWNPDGRLAQWREDLRELCAADYAVLRGFSHQSEREFLVSLRDFLQDRAATKLAESVDGADPPPPSFEALKALVGGLPLLHQEIAFLSLAGYSQATIEKILRITPAISGEGLQRLRAAYPQALERGEDHCLWPAAWLGICNQARAGVEKDCTPLRQLIRILDGQVSWYDKSPAEDHRSKCLHCLELWTSLLEVTAWDRNRQPWPPAQVESLLAALPVKSDARKPSLFARMFGR